MRHHLVKTSCLEMGKLSLREIKLLACVLIATFVFPVFQLHMHDNNTNIYCAGNILSTPHVFIHPR